MRPRAAHRSRLAWPMDAAVGFFAANSVLDRASPVQTLTSPAVSQTKPRGPLPAKREK